MPGRTVGHKRNWVKYHPKELKLIQRVWQETTGKEFKPGPRDHLDEMVEIEIGDTAIQTVKDIYKTELLKGTIPSPGLIYVTKSQHHLAVPNNLKYLFFLALAKNDYAYSLKDEILFTPPLK